MTPEEAVRRAEGDHIPVLLAPVLDALAPKDGDLIVDGTFGAGGYSRAIMSSAQCRVIGIDRDPNALSAAAGWKSLYGERLSLIAGNFADLDIVLPEDIEPDAIVFDIGVSSMQIDQDARGFSFLRDGPLDMRMSQDGPTAQDVVEQAEEAELADIFFQYGEEKRSRALARAVVAARESEPIRTTLQLAKIIEDAAPRGPRGGVHPATRIFQALRIAINGELEALIRGLVAAERRLKSPGGRLIVVTFHSLEDRIVKRFLQARSSSGGGGSRHLPDEPEPLQPSFELLSRKPVLPSDEERENNPRARSAKLRAATRTAAPSHEFDPRGFGLPGLALKEFAS